MRIRLRTLMIAVACVGLLLGGFVWYQRMRQLHDAYIRRSFYYAIMYRKSYFGHKEPPPTTHDEWAARMAAKYERAACYPWLPVAPDEPEPK